MSPRRYVQGHKWHENKRGTDCNGAPFTLLSSTAVYEGKTEAAQPMSVGRGGLHPAA